MKNPIIKLLLETGEMVRNSDQTINDEWELNQTIRAALESKKVLVDYHFASDGRLMFDAVYGRDSNNDFYNERNGNLEAQKELAKSIIVGVLLEKYNSAIA